MLIADTASRVHLTLVKGYHVIMANAKNIFR